MKHFLFIYLPLLFCSFFSFGKDIQHKYFNDNLFAFIENKGQILDQSGKPRKDIQYKLSAHGVNIYVGIGQLHYQFAKASKANMLRVGDYKQDIQKRNSDENATDLYRIDLELKGANKDAIVLAEEEQSFYENYLLHGTNTTAHTFNKVTYKNIYPNIDWVLYLKNGTLEYDFVVHPEGNVNDIKIKYVGNTSLALNDNELKMYSPFGVITENSLNTYIAEDKRSLKSRYVLHDNTVSFHIDRKRVIESETIVIDPKVLWGTYYGGDYDEDEIYSGYGLDIGNVVTDKWSNSYMSGITSGSTNLATKGSYQSTFPGGTSNIFVVKFNPSGQRVWATYFGGKTGTYFGDAICDQQGNFYMAGSTTDTTGIASASSHLDTLAGVEDAFLVKFDSSGTYKWGTYYGSTHSRPRPALFPSAFDSISQTTGASLVCDGFNNIYMSGSTNCSADIATAGAGQDTISGFYDAFLVKFDSSGRRLWGTYLGCSSSAYATSLSTDKYNHLFLGGFADKDTGISTTGTYQPHIKDFYGSSFLTMYDTAGKKKWGTFFGDNSQLTGTATDQMTNVYITGMITMKGTKLFSSGSFAPAAKSYENPFLAKFDSTGNMLWGTFYADSTYFNLGGAVYDVTCNNIGEPIIMGVTEYADNIATPGAASPFVGVKSSGVFNGFIEKFSTTGEKEWGSYLGGQYTMPLGIACDSANNIYVTGGTNKDSLIATPGAYDTIKDTVHISGTRGPEGDSVSYVNFDAFLMKFANDTVIYIVQPFNDTVFCSGAAFTVPYKTNYIFQMGNTFTVQLSDDTGSFNSPVNIGSVTAVGTSGNISCTIPAGTLYGSHYRIRITASSPSFISSDNNRDIHIDSTLSSFHIISNSPVCSGLPLIIKADAAVTYSWSGPDSLKSSESTFIIDSSLLIDSGRYYVTASAPGCSSVTDTTYVVIKNSPARLYLKVRDTVCTTDSLALNGKDSTAGLSYLWAGPGGFAAHSADTAIVATLSGWYKLTASLGSCSVADSSYVSIIPGLANYPFPFSNSPVCASDTLHLWTLDTAKNITFRWTLPDGTVLNDSAISIKSPKAGIYQIIAMRNGCLSPENSILVEVDSLTPAVTITASSSANIHGVADTFVANVTNGGLYPIYQWYVNNVPSSLIPSCFSINNLLIDSSLTIGDAIKVVVHSNARCAYPDTATNTLAPLGVSSIIKGEVVNIYPNPSNGIYHISSNGQIVISTITVKDIVGREVYQQLHINNTNAVVDLSVIANGVYFMTMGDVNNIKTTIKIVKR